MLSLGTLCFISLFIIKIYIYIYIYINIYVCIYIYIYIYICKPMAVMLSRDLMACLEIILVLFCVKDPKSWSFFESWTLNLGLVLSLYSYVSDNPLSVNINTHTYTFTYTQILTYVLTYINAYVNAYMHTYIHTFIHA